MPQKILYFLIFLFLSSCKNNNNNFENSFIITKKLNKNNLLINIKLKKNFHAYAAQEKIGRPVRLEISPTNNWSALGAAIIPQGRAKNLGKLGQSYVLEDNFDIKQEVKIGDGPGKALLYLQICTDTMCDRPRTHEIILDK